jgi:hypothetical protein
MTQYEFSHVRRVLMSFGLKAVVLGAVAALTLGGAAQASEISVTIRTNNHGAPQRIADRSGELLERHQHTRSEHWSEHRDPDHYYGRPVPEWKERRSYWNGYSGVPVVEQPHWQRPVFAGPGWGHRDSCRIIIKERVNRWGEQVQVRTKVCR